MTKYKLVVDRWSSDTKRFDPVVEFVVDSGRIAAELSELLTQGISLYSVKTETIKE